MSVMACNKPATVSLCQYALEILLTPSTFTLTLLAKSPAQYVNKETGAQWFRVVPPW